MRWLVGVYVAFELVDSTFQSKIAYVNNLNEVYSPNQAQDFASYPKMALPNGQSSAYAGPSLLASTTSQLTPAVDLMLVSIQHIAEQRAKGMPNMSMLINMITWLLKLLSYAL
jgi:hypothetical protein